ncbi:MAG: hypothetical protein OEZ36_07245, partial [Spirochaetota bacterium]|nr:hypothetical protein [Spirochaetota bacterium]
MLRTRFLEWCAWLSFNHPWKVLLTFLLLTIISVFYALTSLDFITDQDQLMSDKLKYVQNYMKFKEDFRDLNFLYVVVEAGKNKEQAKKYARAVTEKLKKLPDIKTVLSQVDQRFFKKNLLMFFDESDLKKVLKSIEDMRKELNSWGGIKSLTQVLQYYNRKMSHKSRSQMTNLDFFALYFFLSELDLALAKDNNSSLFRRLISKKVKDYEDESYFYSDKVNKDLLYILILPVKDYKTLSVIQEPLKKIRK